MGDAERLSSLRALVAADPDDLLGRLLLGRELLAHGAHAEAVEHLGFYAARETGDKGAALSALAHALTALGRRAEALRALEEGLANARAHHHLGLVADLEEQRADLAG